MRKQRGEEVRSRRSLPKGDDRPKAAKGVGNAFVKKTSGETLVKSAGNASAKKASGGSSRGRKIQGIRKQYLKSRPACKVTFRLPREAAPDAQKVCIVGDFNNWDKGAAVMKRLKSGDFTITMELETGREYCYRYLIDAAKWENDWWADSYRPNPYGNDDSVVVL